MTFITRSPDHMYTFDGVTYPGTTGILKVLDKSDALMAWASRMTAEAAVELGGSLVPLIEAAGRDGAIKALTARSGWKRDTAASIGSTIHDLADQLVRGVSVGPWPAEVETRVIAYGEWWQASGWKLRASEALLVNPYVGYGGTLDLLCYDADGRTVLAWRSRWAKLSAMRLRRASPWPAGETLRRDGTFDDWQAHREGERRAHR